LNGFTGEAIPLFEAFSGEADASVTLGHLILLLQDDLRSSQSYLLVTEPYLIGFARYEELLALTQHIVGS